MDTRIDISRLAVDRARPLGRGGTTPGVYPCRTPDGAEMVLKEYRPEVLAELDEQALARHVAWRLALPEAERRTLDGALCWPQAVVRSDRRVTGVLMAKAPARFLRADADGGPRKLEALADDAEHARRYGGEHVPVPRKLAALGHLLDVLVFLHGHGVVFGDLHLNNALLSAAPGPVQVYLLDCDACLVRGAGPLPGLRDPVSWRLDGESGFSETTDRYKAALMAVRSLAENTALTMFGPTQFSRILPTAEAEILRALLSPDRAVRSQVATKDLRPMAAAWQSLVSGSGQMFIRNDTYAMAPWPLPDRAGSPVPSAVADRVPAPRQRRSRLDPRGWFSRSHR